MVADDHAGLRAAIREVLPEAADQRCYVHFLRTALDYVPRKVDDDCLQELRWIYDRRDLVPKRAPNWPPGSANGRASTRGWSAGWKRTSRKR